MGEIKCSSPRIQETQIAPVYTAKDEFGSVQKIGNCSTCLAVYTAQSLRFRSGSKFVLCCVNKGLTLR